jgi:hypothetical protein
MNNICNLNKEQRAKNKDKKTMENRKQKTEYQPKKRNRTIQFKF